MELYIKPPSPSLNFYNCHCLQIRSIIFLIHIIIFCKYKNSFLFSDMDKQILLENDPQQYSDEWFKLALLNGREFELPNLSRTNLMDWWLEGKQLPALTNFQLASSPNMETNSACEAGNSLARASNILGKNNHIFFLDSFTKKTGMPFTAHMSFPMRNVQLPKFHSNISTNVIPCSSNISTNVVPCSGFYGSNSSYLSQFLILLRKQSIPCPWRLCQLAFVSLKPCSLPSWKFPTLA